MSTQATVTNIDLLSSASLFQVTPIVLTALPPVKPASSLLRMVMLHLELLHLLFLSRRLDPSRGRGTGVRWVVFFGCLFMCILLIPFRMPYPFCPNLRLLLQTSPPMMLFRGVILSALWTSRSTILRPSSTTFWGLSNASGMLSNKPSWCSLSLFYCFFLPYYL